MAIYTKRGDRGQTSLYDRQNKQNIRIDKNSLRIEAIGAIDELNSFLGIISQVKEIQKDLFVIGSILAGSELKFFRSKTKKLEKTIDKLEGELPVLKNFIIPGGSKDSAYFQYARALARRAERRVVALSKVERVKPQILSYLNRLSDYLFILARYANFGEGIKEEVWKGSRK
ncbi:ATP:cob(I)alamin adenosyltransferase [Candidatus Woesebacteria bacterium RIFCSPHIGHO2_01_FULL_39_28]|uniref:Corrinoid adenosyltransferase n=1 Tax=Candidatus Woesebacteria bacterium RIFCSPHIGHO2_01_FULL_39_28 TaxID=1802496 RepID=A0A1F7Y971_9BACT|nr:MAG: ATP:cob(I)alamin adenosyltransferase [Candidatus Woesebacteria bacterium RIFCSPHIGHO2_01_FULL_39_28]OGM57260.1 MAG: ATP:cob(I)alamin adenosyltransferase [Candidatus Woesebacteria bacterium RIFCSPLOWO2_01_FULL_38_20]